MPLLIYLASRWRECLIALLAAVIAVLYVAWPGPATPTVQIEVQEKIVEKVVTVKEIVYVKTGEKSTVTVIEPSGKKTVTEIEKTAVAEVTKVNKAVDKVAASAHNTKTTPASQSKYMLGATINLDKDVRLIGGARLGNTPFSGVIEYEPHRHSISAGILYQF